jgi:heptosyltransferase-1
MTQPPHTPGRILIIRLSAIGDLVMASPLVGALRGRYPQARIAWLAQSESAPLLEHLPGLDEVIAWPRGDWRELAAARRYVTLAREARGFARRLRARRFDLVVDAQGLLKSAVWAWASRAPARIGLDSREGGALLMTEVVRTPRGDPRISSEYRFLAERLGLDMDAFTMTLGIVDEDRARSAALLGEAGVHGRYAILLPFTTRAQKHWFEERWIELAHRLREEIGLEPVVLGGPADRSAGKRIADAAQAVSLAGATELREAAALIDASALVVGVDTGLTHMGIAADVPTIALFGSTCPYLDTGRANATVIYQQLQCSPCRRRPTCGGRFDCMRAITTDAVLAAARRLAAT